MSGSLTGPLRQLGAGTTQIPADERPDDYGALVSDLPGYNVQFAPVVVIDGDGALGLSPLCRHRRTVVVACALPQPVRGRIARSGGSCHGHSLAVMHRHCTIYAQALP